MQRTSNEGVLVALRQAKALLSALQRGIDFENEAGGRYRPLPICGDEFPHLLAWGPREGDA